MTSLPIRGVWIEIGDYAKIGSSGDGRSPYGECGLKYLSSKIYNPVIKVAPHAGSVD